MSQSRTAAGNKLADRLLATAVHEAGHALAFYRLNFRIKRVTIVPKDDCLGFASSPVGLSFSSLEHERPTRGMVALWHDRVVCLLAGGEAQRRFNSKSMRWGTSCGDLDGVKDILWRLHPTNEQAAVFRYLKIRTQNLINQPTNWRMIQDLAQVLVEKRSLSGDEVLAVLRDSIQQQIRERRDQRAAAGDKLVVHAAHTHGARRHRSV